MWSKESFEVLLCVHTETLLGCFNTPPLLALQ